jgi:hypothetical protein
MVKKMNCPPDVAVELVEILRWGLLNIRTAGYQGDSRRCAQESDHIHNLPALLIDYAPQLLAYYWRTERTLLMNQIGAPNCKAFESAWANLKTLVERECAGIGLDPRENGNLAKEVVATH